MGLAFWILAPVCNDGKSFFLGKALPPPAAAPVLVAAPAGGEEYGANYDGDYYPGGGDYDGAEEDAYDEQQEEDDYDPPSYGGYGNYSGGDYQPEEVVPLTGLKPGPRKLKSWEHVPPWLIIPRTIMSWLSARTMADGVLFASIYGLVGGVAVCMWLTSYVSVGAIMFRLRHYHHYKSLHEAIRDKYGRPAAMFFSTAIAYRLFQILYRNFVISAEYFGNEHDWQWWIGMALVCLVPLVAAMLGGMRWSLLLAPFMLALAVGGTVLILLSIISSSSQTTLQAYSDISGIPFSYNTTNAADGTTTTHTGITIDQYIGAKTGESWTIPGGEDLLALGVVQGMLFFPFHDAVLYDDAFLSSPLIMIVSHVVAPIVTAGFVFFFSFIGVFWFMAKSAVMATPAFQTVHPHLLLSTTAIAATPDYVNMPGLISAYSFNTITYALISWVLLIFGMTSSHAAFISTGKLFALDMQGLSKTGWPIQPSKATLRDINIARIAMFGMACAAVLSLFGGFHSLEDDCITGTMMMGLAPVVILIELVKGERLYAFWLPFIFGLGVGIVQKIGLFHDYVTIGNGDSAAELGLCVVGVCICTMLWCVGLFVRYGERVNKNKKEVDVPAPEKANARANNSVEVGSYGGDEDGGSGAGDGDYGDGGNGSGGDYGDE